MLIYVNQFKLVGENSSQTAFRTVAGWLKNVTNRHFTVAELKSGDEFSINRMKVRTYAAVDLHPYMYSVLFTHPDRETKDVVNGLPKLVFEKKKEKQLYPFC
ncbi:hypothetical protein [Photobacterium leiognathi]|uniref:hypothetical protein n=1 Tax=Photobacterium leiognathi TaxID=553611 RepID=UPI0027384CF0|nr:hypothetical protein [Photobacterium leiognathi]